MRWCVALALISIFASSEAFAAGAKRKGKKKKKSRTPSGPVETLDGVDPVNRERSDSGQYAPKGLTGKLKARQDQLEFEEELARREREKKPYVPPPRDPLVAFADIVLGLGKAPRPAPAVVGLTTDSLVVSMVLGARYDFSPSFTAGARIPWSTASMEIAGSTQTEQEFALGSPEIFGEYRFSSSLTTTIPVFFGIGLPLAQGDPDPNSLDELGRRRATVNLLADAANGWREGELFGIKRLAITAGLGVEHRAPDLVVRAYNKLSGGVNVGRRMSPTEYLGGGELVQHTVSLRNTTFLGATYDLLKKPTTLWAGLDAWMVYKLIDALEFESSAVAPSPIQVVLEPRAGVNVGIFRPSLGVIFPVSGQLSDSEMTGFRLRVDAVF